MTVDVHVFQDHLGLTVEGLAAVGAQVFLQHNSDPYETGNQKIHMNHEKNARFLSALGVFSKLMVKLYIRVPVGRLGVDRIRQQLF